MMIGRPLPAGRPEPGALFRLAGADAAGPRSRPRVAGPVWLQPRGRAAGALRQVRVAMGLAEEKHWPGSPGGQPGLLGSGAQPLGARRDASPAVRAPRQHRAPPLRRPAPGPSPPWVPGGSCRRLAPASGPHLEPLPRAAASHLGHPRVGVALALSPASCFRSRPSRHLLCSWPLLCSRLLLDSQVGFHIVSCGSSRPPASWAPVNCLSSTQVCLV